MPFCHESQANGIGPIGTERADIPRGRTMPKTYDSGLGFEEDGSTAPMFRARPADALAALVEQGYSEDEIFRLVVPKRTLARRRVTNDLLTVEETDKAIRLKRVAAQAQRAF